MNFSKWILKSLTFPHAHFDIASSCHAPFVASELAKVMKKGAFFLTQQVSEYDKLNLKEAFGRGQCLGERDGTLKDKYMGELISAGFELVQVREYDVTDYYSTPEDLIFLLKHTPIIPNLEKKKRTLIFYKSSLTLIVPKKVFVRIQKGL